MAKISGFHHTAIRSAEFDASVAFYKEVLGLTEKIAWGDPGARAIMLDAGDGNYIEIFERDAITPSEDITILHFAFRTDDCAAMIERVRAAGAEVTMEPTEITIPSSIGPVPIKIAFFKGTSGEIVELFENEIL